MDRRRLEEEIAAHLRVCYGAADVLLTDSGTTALTVALGVAMEAQRGDRVALPAYTCFAVATALAGARGQAVLYDVEPETLSPSPVSVEDSLRAGVNVLVACPLYGYPVDVPALLQEANRHDALVVEDAAQASGATFGGRRSGTFAPLTVLSFGRGKGLTCGGGGALLVRDPDLVRAVRRAGERLRPPRSGSKELVRALGEWAFGRPSLYRIPASVPGLGLGETRYVPPSPGRRIATGSALLLREALAGTRPEVRADARRRRAKDLREELPSIEGLVPVRPIPGGEAGELRLPFLVPAGGGGGAPDLGVMPGYPATLDQIAAFRPFLSRSGATFPGAARLVRTLVTAPTHEWIPDDLGARIGAWARSRADGPGAAATTRESVASTDGATP